MKMNELEVVWICFAFEMICHNKGLIWSEFPCGTQRTISTFTQFLLHLYHFVFLKTWFDFEFATDLKPDSWVGGINIRYFRLRHHHSPRSKTQTFCERQRQNINIRIKIPPLQSECNLSVKLKPRCVSQI